MSLAPTALGILRFVFMVCGFSRVLFLVLWAGLFGCVSASEGDARHAHASKNLPVIEMSSKCDTRTCPDYRLQIFADGRVVYTGNELVNVHGDAMGVIAKPDLERLVTKFREAGLFDLPEDYPPPPGLRMHFLRVQLTFRDATREKTIKFTQHFSPPRLHFLTNDVIDATHAKKWICPAPSRTNSDLVCPS